MSSADPNHWFNPFKPFVFGGLSGVIGTSITQPVDTVKVRIQIIGEAGRTESPNPIKVASKMLKNEGISSFYKGLDSALFRQATYATARIGLYRSLYNHRMKTKGTVPFHEKASLSLFAGFISALIGNPSDLALVRFQADATLPPELRRNYKHVFDAFGRIVKEGGVLSLWRGSAPTVARAMSVNLGQLATFDTFKDWVMGWRGGEWDLVSRMYTSVLSGVVCTFVVLPSDNLKTKLQKMKAVDGVYPYNGIFDCLMKSVRREGVLGLWIGIETFFVRVVPHSIAVLFVSDFLNEHFGGVVKSNK